MDSCVREHLELRPLTTPLPEDLLDTVHQLRAAIGRLAASEAEPIKELYSHADDATGFFSWGSYVVG